jgi:hypothetical protein
MSSPQMTRMFGLESSMRNPFLELSDLRMGGMP